MRVRIGERRVHACTESVPSETVYFVVLAPTDHTRRPHLQGHLAGIIHTHHPLRSVVPDGDVVPVLVLQTAPAPVREK